MPGITTYNFEALLERKPIVLDEYAISRQLKGKTILITGAAGSIGSEIARQVLQFNPKCLILIDQAETPLYYLGLDLNLTDVKTDVQLLLTDVTRINQLEPIFKQYNPEVVYHAAAYKHVPMLETNPAQAILANVLGTQNVAGLSVKYNAESFVLVSTDKAVKPGNIMGASKLIAEKYVQALYEETVRSGKLTKLITTRFANVLGSNGSVVPVFAGQIEKGGPVTVTHPDMLRYFMTIDEACRLVLEAGAMGKGAEIFLFRMGQPVRIIELAKKMIAMSGHKPEDIEIQFTGLRPGEKLIEELLGSDSKLMPTHNDAIVIAVEKPIDFNYISKSVSCMIAYAKKNDFEATVAEMKRLLPDFKSVNSKFEAFDNR